MDPKIRFVWVTTFENAPVLSYSNPPTVHLEKSKMSGTANFTLEIDSGTQDESKIKISDVLSP